MAYTEYRNVSYDGFEWRIAGLSNSFNTEYYNKVTIGRSYTGSPVDDVYYLASIYAWSGYEETSTPWGYCWFDGDGGTYAFFGYAQAANDTYYYASRVDISFPPAPEPPTINYFYISSVTQSTMTCQWGISPPSDSYVSNVAVRISGTGDSASGLGSYGSYTFSGLELGTTYTITLTATAGNGLSTEDYTTDTALAITKFYWTTAERSTFNNNGSTTDILYTRWNEFVDKIYEVSGGTWEINASQGATLTYAQTRMSGTDKVLTAARFNSARNNIGIHVATGIIRKYTGDVVIGADFITLETKLNTWIDTL